MTMETLALCSGRSVELSVDEGSRLIVQDGRPPVINSMVEERMRVGCGSTATGMFAQQWYEHVDEVVVVDDHVRGCSPNIRRAGTWTSPPPGTR